MNAYEVNIWASVKHNGIFSHHIERELVIHARNVGEAKNKVYLKKGCINTGNDKLNIEVSEEFIESVYLIGEVEIHPHYVYSGNSRSPILVSEYKAYLKRYNKDAK